MRGFHRTRAPLPLVALFCAALLPVVLYGCGGGGGSDSSPAGPLLPPPPAKKGKHFTHIVILVQENRTFDNLFATYPGADGTDSRQDA